MHCNLDFLELSFRVSAKALYSFVEKRSHVAVWNWVQLFYPNKFYLKRTRVTAFIIDDDGPVSEFTCDFVVNCDDSEAETTASIIRLTLTFSNSFVILLKNRSARVY